MYPIKDPLKFFEPMHWTVLPHPWHIKAAHAPNLAFWLVQFALNVGHFSFGHIALLSSCLSLSLTYIPSNWRWLSTQNCTQ